jgi:hypothetical protein
MPFHCVAAYQPANIQSPYALIMICWLTAPWYDGDSTPVIAFLLVIVMAWYLTGKWDEAERRRVEMEEQQKDKRNAGHGAKTE